MSSQATKPRTRRCSRCKKVLEDAERGRHCSDCFGAVCPRCVECGEPLIGDVDNSGVCYRCWPESDYWLQEHIKDEP
jgi:hypothetical protein